MQQFVCLTLFFHHSCWPGSTQQGLASPPHLVYLLQGLFQQIRLQTCLVYYRCFTIKAPCHQSFISFYSEAASQETFSAAATKHDTWTSWRWTKQVGSTREKVLWDQFTCCLWDQRRSGENSQGWTSSPSGCPGSEWPEGSGRRAETKYHSDEFGFIIFNKSQ